MPADAEDLAMQLEDTGDYRVLRRAATSLGPRVRQPPDTGLQVGIILDCETTGLDPAEADVIELAMLRFEYDRHGVRRILGASPASRSRPAPSQRRSPRSPASPTRTLPGSPSTTARSGLSWAARTS